MSTLCTLKGQTQVLCFLISLPALLSQLSERNTSRGRLNENMGCWKDSSKCLDTILQGQGAQTRWARETYKAFPILVVLVTLSSSFKDSSRKRSLQHPLPEKGPQDLLSSLTEGEQILLPEVCCRRLDKVGGAESKEEATHRGCLSPSVSPLPCSGFPTCVQTCPGTAAPVLENWFNKKWAVNK